MTVPVTRFVPLFFAALALVCVGLHRPVNADDFAVTSAVVGKGLVEGKAVGVATTFRPSDHKLTSVLRFSKRIQASQFKTAWVAVDAAGLKNYVIQTVSLPDMTADTLHSNMTMPRDWPVGKYRVDWMQNGKVIRSLLFAIK